MTSLSLCLLNKYNINIGKSQFTYLKNESYNEIHKLVYVCMYCINENIINIFSQFQNLFERHGTHPVLHSPNSHKSKGCNGPKLGCTNSLQVSHWVTGAVLQESQFEFISIHKKEVEEVILCSSLRRGP